MNTQYPTATSRDGCIATEDDPRAGLFPRGDVGDTGCRACCACRRCDAA
ncbi:MAG: hypothetical protein KJ018_09640 [Burkholderiales bacterium]|nr:hypothetical protein [Burkholderiales bacterium]